VTREIVLDTETTGIDPRRGHRMIEIGCLEIEDLLPTGRTFHRYLNPERLIEPDAIRIHGITNEMVADKPKFADIAQDMLDFIGTSKVIAHNAAFDRGFVNMELERVNLSPLITDQWIDTLEMARQKYPGASNSLDALCKRFNISLADRDKHGALLDSRLLAGVYLELQGGKERGLELTMHGTVSENGQTKRVLDHGLRKKPLEIKITPEETEAHKAFCLKYLKDKNLWGY
jgi:DNA polymerase III subunit epsilon